MLELFGKLSKTGRRGFNQKLYRSKGFTLLEVLVVVVIIGILALIAMFAYNNYIRRARIITVVAEIRDLEEMLQAYSIDFGGIYPADLSVIGYAGFEDPYGNAYVYEPDLTIAPRTHDGVNLNTDFDLYSVGKDGVSAADIDAGASLDDIIRAENGAYRGEASQYK